MPDEVLVPERAAARTSSHQAFAAAKSLSELPEMPAAAQLHRYIEPASLQQPCSAVLDRLFAQPDLGAIPVIDAGNRPVALIERHAFIEFFQQLCAGIGPIDIQPLRIDAATSIDDIARILIDAGLQRMSSGFIVTAENEYLGLANAHDLLQQITQRKQAELYHLAHYDALTNIPNRMLFTDRLQQACRESQRSGASIGLMFVDLDRFKQVNDSMGHYFGDCLRHGGAAGRGRIRDPARRPRTPGLGPGTRRAGTGGDAIAVHHPRPRTVHHGEHRSRAVSLR
jgi:hypothetical protein